MGDSKRILVAGLDPAFRNFGFCLASINLQTGVMTPQQLSLVTTENRSGKNVYKSSDELRRARELIKAARDICHQQVHIVFSEIPAGAQSASAAKQLGIALGVIAALDQHVIEVQPRETKLATVGSASASKAQMIDWAHKKYPDLNWRKRRLKGEWVLTNDNEHLADAVAVIHAGMLTSQYMQVINVMKRVA